MTPQARAVLYYLNEYLRRHPEKLAALNAFHLKQTREPLSRPLRWKHLNLRVRPSIDATLVYLGFLHLEGELLPAPTPGDLFTFAHPAYLKKK